MKVLVTGAPIRFTGKSKDGGVMKKDLLRGLYLLSWTTASILAADKITLLTYCQEFLASDVSSWSKVVESLKRKRNQLSGAA